MLCVLLLRCAVSLHQIAHASPPLALAALSIVCGAITQLTLPTRAPPGSRAALGAVTAVATALSLALALANNA